MSTEYLTDKVRQWLKRYIPGEILGTIGALLAASIVYSHTHSLIAGAASGWIGEGIGFYGYFICAELVANSKKYRELSAYSRFRSVLIMASTNLFFDFAPAEIIDNLFVRPFTMYLAPLYIHPYPIGFLIGKFSADFIFYSFAVCAYEIRLRTQK